MKRTVVFLTLVAIVLLVLSTSVVLAAKEPKVNVCHYDVEEGVYYLINISGNAVQKHLDNHVNVDETEGDWLPGEDPDPGVCD